MLEKNLDQFKLYIKDLEIRRVLLISGWCTVFDIISVKHMLLKELLFQHFKDFWGMGQPVLTMRYITILDSENIEAAEKNTESFWQSKTWGELKKT